MFRPRTLLTAFVCIALAAGVCACDNDKNDVPEPSGDAEILSAGTEKQAYQQNEVASQKKLGAYVDAFNLLTSTPPRNIRSTWLTLVHNFKSFRKTNNGKHELGYPRVDGLEIALNGLRAGKAIQSGSMADLDAAVDAFLVSGQKLLELENELVPYFNKGGYRRDNLAKGRAKLPEIDASFQQALADLELIGARIENYERINTELRLKNFREKGDMVMYYTEDSLLLAGDVLSVFKADDALNRAENYQRADQLAQKLEQSIEAQRQALRDSGESSSALAGVADSLTAFVGYYRELKNTRSAAEFNSAMNEYNRAARSFTQASIIPRHK